MNTHTPETFAALLQGREYGNEITKEESAIAKAAGLVVVFGYSDDNCELRGAIHDEVGCYDGGVIYFTASGKIHEEPDSDEVEVLEKFGLLEQLKKQSREFAAVWGEGGPAWTYAAEFPHATFDIMEDGGVFCRGMVFRLADAFTKEGA